MNYCVDVPNRVSRALAPERSVPVSLTAGGETAETTALRRAGGGYRVFLSTPLRRAASVSAGDSVSVSLRRLAELQEPETPDDLERALVESPRAKQAWQSLTLRQRRDFLRYLNEARSTPTRMKRLSDGLEKIQEKTERRRARD